MYAVESRFVGCSLTDGVCMEEQRLMATGQEGNRTMRQVATFDSEKHTIGKFVPRSSSWFQARFESAMLLAGHI